MKFFACGILSLPIVIVVNHRGNNNDDDDDEDENECETVFHRSVCTLPDFVRLSTEFESPQSFFSAFSSIKSNKRSIEY